MSLKRLFGGEVNEKFISKQKQKEIELEKELDAKCLKGWNNSKNSTEVKIKNLIEIWKDVDPDFPRRFFTRHPELVSPELNPFNSNLKTNKELKLENENLKLKNKLKEKELELKLKEKSQSQY